MVLLLCRWMDADVSGRFTTSRHVRRPLQRTSVFGALKFVTYTEDLPAVIQRFAIHHHLYADYTQLSDEPPITSIAASISNMEHYVDAVHAWCSAKRLQLNPSQSEIIWFGTRATLKRLEDKSQSTFRDGYGHALQCCAWPRRPSWQRTDHATTYQSDYWCVFLPSSTSEEGPAYFRIQRNMLTRHCICYESSRLLQRASGGPSAVNHRAAATESRTPLFAWLVNSDLAIMWLHLNTSSTGFQ